MSAPSPDSFFEKQTLLPMEVAKYIHEDLAVGPDGTTWRYEGGVWTQDPEVIRSRAVKLLQNRYKSSHVATISDAVVYGWKIPEIPASPVGEEEWAPLINLRNGVYHWDANYLGEHHKSYLHTVQLPIEFDEEATCPLFDAWIEEVLPADLHYLVWEVLGYMLMSGNPKQKAFLLLGPGGTGKSTFLRILEKMLGKVNTSSQSLKALSTDRFAPAELFGKIANVRSDIEASYMEDSTLFKQLTGGDTMSAQRKYGHPFSFTPWATPIFSANKTWRSEDDTSGYFRRWIILPFMHRVDRSKPFDEARLYAEIPGIFNKAMANLRVLHDRGDFEQIGTAREAAEEFERDSDGVRLWLAEDVLVMSDAGNGGLVASRSEVFERYRYWTLEVNRSKSAKTNQEFYKSMRALGFTEKRSSSDRFLVGIRVSSGLGIAV